MLEMQKEKCRRCNSEENLTRHHVFPVRWWGRDENDLRRVILCNSCHRKVERLILKWEGYKVRRKRRILKRYKQLEAIDYLKALKALGIRWGCLNLMED